MQVVSSMTTTAPEPAIDWFLAMSSIVTGVSRCSSTNQGAVAPPGIHALSSLPSRMPPPTS